MGAKQSSPAFDSRTRAYSSSDLPSGNSAAADGITGFRYTNGPDGPRIRYTGGGPTNSGMRIPTGRRDEGELPPEAHRLFIGSLPSHLSPRLLGGFHCPVCSKFMAADEIEKHLLVCFSKTRLIYNKDILSRDSGECTICLDDLEQGDTIARLPCLCIYHKGCIDEWFQVNRSCPEHPAD
uniref:E3 ubiquitin-protein ligase ZNRF1 n=1 Tax=Poecilia latipinna TaxID=48699 RepID=A0A3B3UL75_9TELE